jgi:hypothetical protein
LVPKEAGAELPVSGLEASSRGWTRRTSRRARSSHVSTTTSSPGRMSRKPSSTRSSKTSQASGPPSRPCLGAVLGSVSIDSTTPIGVSVMRDGSMAECNHDGRAARYADETRRRHPSDRGGSAIRGRVTPPHRRPPPTLRRWSPRACVPLTRRFGGPVRRHNKRAGSAGSTVLSAGGRLRAAATRACRATCASATSSCACAPRGPPASEPRDDRPKRTPSSERVVRTGQPTTNGVGRRAPTPYAGVSCKGCRPIRALHDPPGHSRTYAQSHASKSIESRRLRRARGLGACRRRGRRPVRSGPRPERLPGHAAMTVGRISELRRGPGHGRVRP